MNKTKLPHNHRSTTPVDASLTPVDVGIAEPGSRAPHPYTSTQKRALEFDVLTPRRMSPIRKMSSQIGMESGGTSGAREAPIIHLTSASVSMGRGFNLKAHHHAKCSAHPNPADSRLHSP